MFETTSTDWAPWHVVTTDDKRRGRLNLITHLLSQVSYTPLEKRSVTLPNRQPQGKYREPDLSSRYVPIVF
jgi:hypothetical protein